MGSGEESRYCRCRSISDKREVFEAPRTTRGLYISVWDTLVDRLDGKVETGINIVDLVNTTRGLGIAHIMQVVKTIPA